MASVERDLDAPSAGIRAVGLEMVNAVLGGDGLARVAWITARAVGRPIAIVAPRSRIAFVAPTLIDIGELESYVTDRVAGRPTVPPEIVTAEEPIVAGDELIGIVAVLRGDTPVHTDAGDYLHLAAVAAMTQVAVTDAREEVAERLRLSFLEQLRTGDELDAADVIRRAARLGCDLAHGGIALCAKLQTDRPGHVVATICGDWPGALAQHDGAAATGRVYGLLPATGTDEPRSAIAASRRLAKRLEHLATVGLSSFYADAADLNRAMREAELVLDVLHASGTPTADDIGSATYRLLFRVLASHPAEVRTLYEDTIAPIVRYDEQYRSELLTTLDAYLNSNCNMNATAAALSSHRHTIAYKLDRVRELTELDPLLTEDRERLGLGLKAYRIILPRLRREIGRGRAI